MNNKTAFVRFIILIIILLIIGYSYQTYKYSPNNALKNKNVVEGRKLTATEIEQKEREVFANLQNQIKDLQEKQKPFSDKDVVIKINPITALSYKKKEDIYNSRKYYVGSSIFNKDDYEPSEAVFGQIEDGKPWISANICLKADGSCRVDGPSEESIFINNPSVLVSIDTVYVKYPNGEGNYPECHRNIIPVSARYISANNEIEVIYNGFYNGNPNNNYMLKGLNARDLGYEYAYVDTFRSRNLVKFTQQENISNSIIAFQDFLHTGGSCGVEGGCNNGSPHQPLLEFKYPNSKEKITIYIKLWKNRPASPSAPADINEKLIILPNSGT